jgi:MFS family permease
LTEHKTYPVYPFSFSTGIICHFLAFSCCICYEIVFFHEIHSPRCLPYSAAVSCSPESTRWSYTLTRLLPSMATIMMSLVNTNRSYLHTMRIAEDSPIVGIIVSVYYLGCAIGAVIASFWPEKRGRTPSTFACLRTITFGNHLMFISGLNGKGGGSNSWNGAALACMLTGRVVMGLGVWRNRRCDSRVQFRTIF